MITAPKNNEQEGKHQPSLLPLDLLMELMCPAYLEGTIKYIRESWRHGFKMSVMFDACQRHLEKFFYQYEDYDKETWDKYRIKKHHLGAAMFCIVAMYWTQKIKRKDLDDRPNHIPKLTGPDIEEWKQKTIEELEKEETDHLLGLTRKKEEQNEENCNSHHRIASCPTFNK
jgi:hypothetical protein